MKVKHGKLTFLVDDHTVNSEELQAMSFYGDYKLGVSMQKAGQTADVFFGCPVTFKDIWAAGDVSGEMMIVKKSKNFTFFSNEVLKPRGRYAIIAKVLRNCHNSVGLGIVPADCMEMCQSNLPGTFQGSIACLIKNGSIVVMMNDDVAFNADVDTAAPNVLMMAIDDGQLTFSLDGRKVDCEVLESTRVTEDFRIGVGCSYEGQVLEMRGNGSDTGAIIPDKVKDDDDDSLTGFGKELIDLIKGIAESADIPSAIPSASPSASPSDVVRWKDNMKSVDCDSSDRVAICVKKFTATVFSQHAVAAYESHSIDIQVLDNPSSSMGT
ncbi:MAG: hypothetical protein SGARI_003753, partial [Bacillariaceae sp.]